VGEFVGKQRVGKAVVVSEFVGGHTPKAPQRSRVRG
jgi:hypothetical protein